MAETSQKYQIEKYLSGYGLAAFETKHSVYVVLFCMCRVSMKTGYKFDNVARTPTMGKAVRQTTPPYSRHALNEAMVKFVKEKGIRHAFDFGVYKSIMMGQAVRGLGLVHNIDILKVMLSITPYAYVKHLDLKAAVIECALKYEGLWPKNDKPLDRWASAIAERIFLLLNHVRRLKFSPIRWRQCIKSLDNDCIKMLRDIVDSIKAATRNYDSMEQAGEIESTQPYDDLDALGRDGFEHSDMDGEADIVTPAKKAKLNSGKASKKSTPKDDTTPEKLHGAKKASPTPVHKLIPTYATHQSYVQVVVDGKKSLVVACSQKQHADHKKVIEMIYKYLVEIDSADKDVAKNLRTTLIN